MSFLSLTKCFSPHFLKVYEEVMAEFYPAGIKYRDQFGNVKLILYSNEIYICYA